MFSYVYLSKDHPLGAKFKEFMSFGKDMYKNVMKTAVPVIFNEGLWALSVSMVFAAYGRIGPSAPAIVQVANTITEVLQTAYAGVFCNRRSGSGTGKSATCVYLQQANT